MQVMVWFYEHMDTLGKLMDMVLAKRRMKEGLDDDDVSTLLIYSHTHSFTN